MMMLIDKKEQCLGAQSDRGHDALPPAPRVPEETGLPFLFLVELVSKVLFLRGQVRLLDLAAHLKLSATIIDAVIVFMRAEKLCEVTRRGNSNTDIDLSFTLTDVGRGRAAEFLNRSAYAGPAPVTLHQYCSQVEAQSVKQMNIVREDIAREFEGIVVNPVVLEQFGAAMNSGRAVFIHGPAGSGKTYLAERLAGLLKGDVWVPYAVLVDGEVVQIHDPAVHQQEASDAPQASMIDRRNVPDPRWVRCKRPAVLTGGELTLNMLELQFDPGTRYYQAPPHLKANNGIFIIDDLGRQRCSPAELMNRWIVPLDRRMDHLALHTGHKFVVPFDVVVVFSSNFPPDQLADGAFLRRMGYKILVGEQTEPEYERIFRQACERYGVPYSDDAFRYMLKEHHAKEGRPLLACYPRDIVSQVRDLARYEDTMPVLSEHVVDWAWNNYFTGS
jgi:energy-coupling factor transporter ATP-binding protein EcfA2